MSDLYSLFMYCWVFKPGFTGIILLHWFKEDIKIVYSPLVEWEIVVACFRFPFFCRNCMISLFIALSYYLYIVCNFMTFAYFFFSFILSYIRHAISFCRLLVNRFPRMYIDIIGKCICVHDWCRILNGFHLILVPLKQFDKHCWILLKSIIGLMFCQEW